MSILSKQFIAENGTTYTDHKRILWSLSIFTPALTLLGPMLYTVFENEWYLAAPILIVYFLMPALDWIVGDDKNNPPEDIVPQLENDLFYRAITFCLVPLLVAGLVFSSWFVSYYSLSFVGWLMVVFVTGFIGGYGINLGHEMGHKPSLWERWGAKVALSISAYGHFNVEHNRGHHVWVATPHDLASSKMGESIYRFFLREYPKTFGRAWQLEKERLEKRNRSAWSLSNEVIQSALLTFVIYGAIVLWLGIQVLPFLLLTALWGSFQLTSANYIEHYGLKRKKLENGRYERCQPKHSWNSNHLVSNWSLLHLQRHSDHHANPMRRYQSLRNFDDIPQLPAGYYTMFMLSYVPPLWFKVMDPKVWQATKGDWDSINVLPAKENEYKEKFDNRAV